MTATERRPASSAGLPERRNAVRPVWRGRRNVLDLDDWEPGEIVQVLDTAASMKQILARPVKKLPTLRGKTIVTAFYESSTRTRISFEVAAKILGADCVKKKMHPKHIKRLQKLLDAAGVKGVKPEEFTRYGSARTLYNFNIDNADAY